MEERKVKKEDYKKKVFSLLLLARAALNRAERPCFCFGRAIDTSSTFFSPYVILYIVYSECG